MSMQLFFDIVPDCYDVDYLTIPKKDKTILPNGTFIFMELYCSNTDCDCRGGLIEVFKIDRQGYACGKVLAAINFSWEQASSQGWEYSLQSDMPKTKVAKLFLESFIDRVESCAEYRESLKTHYDMFKKQITSPECLSATQLEHGNGKKIGRNELCPCGSGKKYKKCCLNKKNKEAKR